MRALIVLILIFAACSEPPRPVRQTHAARVEPTPPTPAPNVLAHEESERLRSDGEPYTLHRFRIPLARTRIAVVDMEMRTDLDRVLRERSAALVINGGYYSPELRPEGLVIVEGRELNPLLPRLHGGIVSVLRNGRAEHRASDAFTVSPDVEFAIQCSPQLVVGAQSAIERVGEATASRTALCIRDGGRGLDVYIANAGTRGRAGPTIHTFARELVAEGCQEALNLDGGPSTGAAWIAADGPRSLLPLRGVRHAIVFTLR